MGRFKELRDKQAADKLTDEEKSELAELQKDFDEANGDGGDGEDEEKAIDELSDKLVEKTLSKVDERVGKLESIAEKLLKVDDKKHEELSVKTIVDPELGKATVKQLEEATIEIAERKNQGKKNFTVSKKSVHFVQAMLQQDRQKLQVLVEGTAASGGYLVPDEFANMIIEDRRDAAVMRNLATVIPVTSDSFHLPTLASRPKVFWRNEAGVKQTSTAQFGEIVLTPYSLAAIVPLSNELVADASLGVGGSIVAMVANLMATAIAEEEDKAFWTGNGSGKPTGIDNYSFTTIDAGAGASDQARAAALIRAFYRLPQGYRNSAVAVANATTWAKVAQLKNDNGDFLLTSMINGTSRTLLGRPTYEQNDLPDGKLFFGDFSDYVIADRQGITVDVSTEATVGGQSAFERNLTYVRVEERVDGELALTNGIVEVQNLGSN